MSLVEHAVRELVKLGWLGATSESDDPKDVSDAALESQIASDAVELITLFAEQGHSGGTAATTIGLFGKLAGFGVLTPLTGENDEWEDRTEMSKGGIPEFVQLFQNKRYSSVFRRIEANGNVRHYDIEAVHYYDEHHEDYSLSQGFDPITFPYMPKVQYIYRPSYADEPVKSPKDPHGTVLDETWESMTVEQRSGYLAAMEKAGNVISWVE